MNRRVILAVLLCGANVQALAADNSWASNFDDGLGAWGKVFSHWGKENMSFFREPGVEGQVLRVQVHQGGIDPATMRQRGVPVSGTGFHSRFMPGGVTAATLSYRVRFPADFPWVRGGKLPGLDGGVGNGGGKIPDGTDGFSFRLMWLQGGKGRIYAYLPSSVTYGTPLLEGKFGFQPGRWHRVMQELVLNTPGQADGSVKLWLDGVLVGAVEGLVIRTVDRLTIDGIFFDYFFGGNDNTWAAPKETYTDFAEFKVRWR